MAPGGEAALKATPPLTTIVMDGVITGAPTPLLALTVKVKLPGAVGVPDRTPVEKLRVRPGGSVPVLTAKTGAGVPVAANV